MATVARAPASEAASAAAVIAVLAFMRDQRLTTLGELPEERDVWRGTMSALYEGIKPKWLEVWSHIYLGKIFDISGQRERAVNEYTQAQRTRDNTQGAQDEVAKYLKTPYRNASKEAI